MCEGTKGLRRKFWTQTKILIPNIRYFVVILRSVAIYAVLEDFGQKYCLFFFVKTVFLRQEVHYYMVYFANYTELDLQICNYAQKRRICRKISICAADENFYGHFCPPQNAARGSILS